MNNRKKYDPDVWAPPTPQSDAVKGNGTDAPKKQSKFQKRFENRTLLVTKNGSAAVNPTPLNSGVSGTTMDDGAVAPGLPIHEELQPITKERNGWKQKDKKNVEYSKPACIDEYKGEETDEKLLPDYERKTALKKELTKSSDVRTDNIRKVGNKEVSAQSVKGGDPDSEIQNIKKVSDVKVKRAQPKTAQQATNADRTRGTSKQTKSVSTNHTERETKVPLAKKTAKGKANPRDDSGSVPVAEIEGEKSEKVGEDGQGYVPYTLHEYQKLMEKANAQKAGGLGPSDTDEQRMAAERKQRQIEYGLKASELAREQLAAQAQRRNTASTELSASPTAETVTNARSSNASEKEGHDLEPSHSSHEVSRQIQNRKSTEPTIRQPPSKEHIVAKQRRERALEYARNVVPSPTKSAAAKKPRKNSNRNSKELNSFSNVELLHEERMLDLEMKHQQDMEAVELIKKQMGL